MDNGKLARNGSRRISGGAMDQLKKTLRKICRMLDIGPVVYSGRSSEINLRIADLTGRQVINETPSEEYKRLAAMAKRAN